MDSAKSGRPAPVHTATNDLPGWQKRVNAYNAYLKSKIPLAWRLSPQQIPSPEQQPDITGTYLHQYLSEGEVKITEHHDASKLLYKLRSGELTSVEVTRAFCHRSALCHQLLNCLLEIRYEEAIKEAEKLDQEFKRTGKPVGLLHGLPISMKDSYVVRGLETTNGYVRDIGMLRGKTGPADRKGTPESQMVLCLRQQGGVIFCKTSLPQSLVVSETNNNIAGFCCNPRNRTLSAGGSSGGECALLAAHGSPMGIGTDSGGSLRIPTHFNGLYSLKPTGDRLPFKGTISSTDGQSLMPTVTGPITNSLEAVEVLFKAILQTEPWNVDPYCCNVPWQKTSLPEKLCFGVMRTNGYTNPWPTITRGIDELVEGLKAKGHKVIEWKGLPQSEAEEFASKINSTDGFHEIHAHLADSGEPAVPQLHSVIGDRPSAQMSIGDYVQLTIRRTQFAERYYDYWNSTSEETGIGRPVDAILCPVTPTAAVQFNGYQNHGYTTLFNVLDFPSVVLPLTTVDAERDTYPADYTPLNEIDRSNYEMYTDKPQRWEGMPVGLQVVGRRREEEKALATARVVDATVKELGVGLGHGLARQGVKERKDGKDQGTRLRSGGSQARGAEARGAGLASRAVILNA